MASDLNVSVNYIGQIERGERLVSLNMADKLCSYFHLTLDYLYRGISADVLCEQISYEPDPFRELLQMIELCSEQEIRLCLDILRPVLAAWRSSLETAKAEQSIRFSRKTAVQEDPDTSTVQL